MEEIWRDIPSLEGAYQASNLGRIKSLSRLVNHPSGGVKRIKERILKIALGTSGYYIVGIAINGKNTTKTVHRLIAKTFIDNPENKPEVNHKDGNKLNNNLSNLEWSTVSENRYHAFRTGLQKAPFSMLGKKGAKCPNSVPVYKIDMSGKKEYFESTTIAQENTGVDRSSISKCAMGKVKIAGGYKWEYA